MNLRSFLLRIRRRGGARYARGIRAALRVAREAGLLDDAQKRVMYAVEMRNLERLVLRADIQLPECYNSAQNTAFRDSCSSCCDALVRCRN